MGAWRGLWECFASCTTTSVTDPEKFTPRMKQIDVAVLVEFLMGGTRQVVLKIARSSYTGLPTL